VKTFSDLFRQAFSGRTVTCRFIVRGYVAGATYAACDGPSDLTWDNGSGALTYRAFGEALRITLPTYDAQSKVNPATIALSGTDPAVLGSIFVEAYRAQPCQIALLIFDPATGAPAEEIVMVDGLMDVASISDSPAKPDEPDTPQVSTLTLSVIPRTVDMKRGSGRYASDSDQRLHRDAADGFFKDVGLVAVSTINWGQAGPTSPARAAASGGLLPPGISIGFTGPPVIF
jgi:hypothetical protein